MSDRPLDAGDITALLGEVADELADDPGRRIVVVGGALLALHGLREATRDVDSTSAVDEDLRDAVARVAARHGLAPAWLNDRAKPFLPVTFDEAACEVLLDRAGLTVLGAPLDQVFLMKLFASRAADVDDLEVLWEHCTFETPEAAAAAFHLGYPHLEHDEHLADHIRRLI
ncbi:MAG: DUF6036 family nucleotidyltransferase [Microthrixaceae bacterium]